MTRWLLTIGLLLVALVQPAAADQKDERLDQLFAQLQGPMSPAAAAAVEQQIWAIWFVPRRDAARIQPLMQRGNFAMSIGQLERAERAYDEVIALDPEFAEGWNRRATVRYMRGDYQGSIADIGETLALEPRHFGALSGLGLCYTELEDPEHALSAFESALEVNPHMPGAKANVEQLRQMLGGAPI